MTEAASPSSSRLPVIPFIVLGVSLLLTAAAAMYVAAVARAADRARFENTVERTNVAIQRRIETYVDLLRGGGALFVTQPRITPAQFKRYVDRLALNDRYPGIVGMGVSARIGVKDKDAIVQWMHDQGMSSFDIHPADPARQEYHAVLYFEPQTERGPAMGYDMFTEPTRRTAMEMARDTGDAATSAKLTLLRDLENPNKQAGFVIYTPIYYLGGVPETIELRRALLAGFAFARRFVPTIYWQEFSATSSTHPASPSPSTMDPPPPTRRCCINPIAMILCRRTLASMTSRTCKSPADRGRSSIAAVPISCQAHRRD